MMGHYSWGTDLVPPQKRIHTFAELIDRIHLGWQLDAYDSESFDASISGRNLGDLNLTDVVVDPVYGQRTKREIAQMEGEYYAFICVLFGEELIQQGNQVAHLKAGDSTLWFTNSPASFSSKQRTRQVSLFIPRDIVECRIPNAEELCCRKFGGERGYGTLLQSYFKTLPSAFKEIQEDTALYLVDPVIDMILGAVGNHPETAGNQTTYRNKLLNRIKNYIAENITQPTLSPASIAQEFGFSSSYLHRIFRENKKTVAGYIRYQRLINAKMELEKDVSSMSITDLAFKSGFHDSSHFSRSFKQAFGVSPSLWKNRKSNPS